MAKTIPIIIPFYQEDFNQFIDFIDSIQTYFSLPYHLVIVDDVSQDGSYEKLLQFEKEKKNVTIYRNKKKNGWGWGMWLNVGNGLTWAHENLEFDFAIRLDCDALIIKEGMDTILSRLYENKKIALACHLQGQQNHRWFWNLRIARKWKELAKKNGYFKRQDTENCFWFPQEGITSFSHGFIAKLIDHDMFNLQKDCGGIYKWLLGPKGLFDGPFLATLCYAFGFEAVDISIIRSYFGIENLLTIPYPLFRDLGVCAIHPIKRIRSENSLEAEIRRYFQKIRQADKLSV